MALEYCRKCGDHVRGGVFCPTCMHRRWGWIDRQTTNIAVIVILAITCVVAVIKWTLIPHNLWAIIDMVGVAATIGLIREKKAQSVKAWLMIFGIYFSGGFLLYQQHQFERKTQVAVQKNMPTAIKFSNAAGVYYANAFTRSLPAIVGQQQPRQKP